MFVTCLTPNIWEMKMNELPSKIGGMTCIFCILICPFTYNINNGCNNKVCVHACVCLCMEKQKCSTLVLTSNEIVHF